MSLTLSFYVIFITSDYFLHSTNCYTVPKRDMCPKATYDIPNGELWIKGTVSYRLQCQDGFVAPWGFSNQSYEYKCDSMATISESLPRGCIEKQHAYRRIEFGVKVHPTKEGKHICDDNENWIGIQHDFDSGKTPKSDYLNMRLYKGDIPSCTIVNETFSQIKVAIRGVSVINKTEAEAEIVYADIILKAYTMIQSYIAKRGYSPPKKMSSFKDVYKDLIYYKGDNKIAGYDCEPFQGHRIDGGQVCVGCGKGWWMDEATFKCHPCGPGYFNDKEAAAACIACPLMYTNAPWSAKNVDECFNVDLPAEILHRQILEGLLTPTIFLLSMLIITIILSKIAMSKENFSRQSKDMD